MRPVRVERVEVSALDAPMKEPFEIAGGSSTEMRNVLVRVALDDGAIGHGEGAPMTAFNGETQSSTLAAAQTAARALQGRPLGGFRPALERVESLLPGQGAARAAVGMALADAWARAAGIPLRLLFGGTASRVRSDVTVTIVSPEAARRAAERIVGLGVDTIKIKIGKGVEEDAARVRAVASVRKGLRLILDANQGYGPREALALLKSVRRAGIEPALFEQPTAKEDWSGLAEVHKHGRIDVAADESVSSREDAVRMAARRCAQVVNVKIMKCGLLEAWDIALICRAAGLGLMAGGMVESSLAMACAAHLAAGVGGFDYIDLDTPLWLARDPMSGVRFGRAGWYDLSRVKSGLGSAPKKVACPPSKPVPTNR